MTLKNTIDPNHVPLSKYQLNVLGLPLLKLTKVGGIEKVLKVANLPDKTSASGGQQDPFDLVCELPLHHSAERQAIEEWYKEGQDPVTATYKKSGVMSYKAIDDSVSAAYSLIGAFCMRLKYPDSDMEDDETMGVLEFTLRVDDAEPL